MLSHKYIETFLEKNIHPNSTIALGTDKTSYKLVRELALKNVLKDLNVLIFPASVDIATMAHEYNLKIASFSNQIDLFIDFASEYDSFYNYTKTSTQSLIRDKMLAYYAKEVIVFAQNDSKKDMIRDFPIEIARFGYLKTISFLDSFGEPSLRQNPYGLVRTLGQNYIVDFKLDSNYTYEDLDFKIKGVPGIIETGLFVNLADKIYSIKKNSMKII